MKKDRRVYPNKGIQAGHCTIVLAYKDRPCREGFSFFLANSHNRGIRGYDGGKRLRGRKRHIVVDVLGLVLVVMVHSAGIQDRDGAKAVLKALVTRFPGLQLIWADGGYAGKLVTWVAPVLQRTLVIVKRPRHTQGFQVLQWRWIVERTFGWLNRSR